MTANEIRNEIMSMTYTDPNAVANALEHVVDKLCQFEHEIEVLTYYKADQPYTPSPNNDF